MVGFIARIMKIQEIMQRQGTDYMHPICFILPD